MNISGIHFTEEKMETWVKGNYIVKLLVIIFLYNPTNNKSEKCYTTVLFKLSDRIFKELKMEIRQISIRH